MANLCCMTGCTVDPAKDVYYFKLPTKPALRRRWLEVIKPCSKLSMDASVCSAHFATTDYETVRGKTRLKKNKVPMNIDELKSQSSDDHTNNSNESTKSDKLTNKTAEKGSNIEENGSKDSEKGTENHENGVGDEKLSKRSKKRTRDKKGDEIRDKEDDGARDEKDGARDEKDGARDEVRDEIGDEMDSQGEKVTDSQMETENIGMNGEQECHDPNAIEIQITPDIIEDYNPIQVTPDIIEDYDALKPPDPLEPDINHDIEDILTNYHIMNPPSRRDREKPSEKPSDQPEKPSETSDKPAEKPSEKQVTNEKPSEKPKEKQSEKPMEDNVVQTIEDDDDDLPLGVSSKPVFIEIPVDKGRNTESGDKNDCLMVLESLQVSIDPSSLMLPEQQEIEEIEIDDKSDDDDDEKNRDPISLLTSSDEDEVIIEEPHIDTVEVSDETDEDDVPLVRLVKPQNCTLDITKIFWGAREYFCTFCSFCTLSHSQYKSHVKTHTTTAIQICQVCGFTTASEYQFSRHKKKHKDDRRYKCHLCDYKARHNMSLIYHLKIHDKDNKGFRCEKCGFKSNVRSRFLKHSKECRKVKFYKCAKCRYSTKRNSDLKRHVMRKHQDSDDDEPWISN